MSDLYPVNCDVHSYCGKRPCPWCQLATKTTLGGTDLALSLYAELSRLREERADLDMLVGQLRLSVQQRREENAELRTKLGIANKLFYDAKQANAELRRLVDEFKASALLDVGGDPDGVQPRHIAQHITELRRGIERLHDDGAEQDKLLDAALRRVEDAIPLEDWRKLCLEIWRLHDAEESADADPDDTDQYDPWEGLRCIKRRVDGLERLAMNSGTIQQCSVDHRKQADALTAARRLADAVDSIVPDVRFGQERETAVSVHRYLQVLGPLLAAFRAADGGVNG